MVPFPMYQYTYELICPVGLDYIQLLPQLIHLFTVSHPSALPKLPYSVASYCLY